MPPRVTLDLAFCRRWSRPLALKPFLLLWLVRPDRGLPFCACVLPGSSSRCGTLLTSLLLRLVSGYRFWLNSHCLRILVATWVWGIAPAWHANPEVPSFLCTLGSCEPSVSGSGSMARISLQYAWVLRAQLCWLKIDNHQRATVCEICVLTRQRHYCNDTPLYHPQA